MPHREELHQLVERIPPHELHTALRFMQFLCGQLPPEAHLLVVDDPGHEPDPPETPEERAAWQEYERQLAKIPPLETALEPDAD